jgi:hypothetical protein
MNNIYKKNLESLKNKNLFLYNKIVNLEENKEIFKVEKTKDNIHYTLKLKIKNKYKYVHSKYNPKKHAKKEIDKLELKYYNLIGVAGFGMGYFVEELLKRINSQSKVIIFENEPLILKEVMKFRDITNIIESKNLKIFDCSDENYISQLKKTLIRLDYMALVSGNVVFFETPVLKEKFKEKFNIINKNFINILKYSVNSLGNDPGDTLLGIRHMFENIEDFINSKVDIDNLDKFKNKPAICVASGPSLDKNINLLEKYQDKVLIFSAGTSLYKLINHNIYPDFFSVLERPEKVYKYTLKKLVENDQYPKDIIAFLDGVVHPKIFEEASPNIIPVVRNTVPTEKWFSEGISDLIAIDTGMSVANLNFMIAHLLGFSPIILLGQDLAFSPEGKQHAEGTTYDELGEKKILEKDIVEVEGYNGEKLKARRVWRDFKSWFEYTILENNIDCIDATEGGAYIKGTKVMDFEEVIDEYLDGNKIDSKSIIDFVDNEEKNNKLNSISEKTERKIDSFNIIEKRINYIKSLLNLFKQFINFSKAKNSLDIDFIVEKYSYINSELALLMSYDHSFHFICQAPFVEMERNKVRKGDIKKNTFEKLNTWINYNIDKLNDLNNILKETKEIFEDGLNKIEDLKEKYEC